MTASLLLGTSYPLKTFMGDPLEGIPMALCASGEIRRRMDLTWLIAIVCLL